MRRSNLFRQPPRYRAPTYSSSATGAGASTRVYRKNISIISSVVGSPHCTSIVGSGLNGLSAELSKNARVRSTAPADRPPVMYLSAGGAVAGSDTMMDAVIAAAGGRNLHAGASWTVLPLERLVETPPALIALGFFDTGRTVMNAWSPSRHPAFRRALANARTVSLPPAAISCQAWYAVDAAEILAAALRTP